jgi:transcriptional repressor NrdR
MVCLYCGGKTEVANSRRQKRNNQVWRRRRCLQCSAIFTTHEAIDVSSSLMVEIRGLPVPFVPDKLYTEVLLALQDRPDCYIAAKEVTSTVINALLGLPESPIFIPTSISAVTARVLKRFDSRAYLRYVAEHPSLQT